MTALASTPLEEERAALRQQRHMEKMHREAERTRQRERRAAQRAEVRKQSALLADAERAAGSASRGYHRALDALRRVKESDPMMVELRLRQCDREYNRAMAASGEAAFYRRKLEVARRG